MMVEGGLGQDGFRSSQQITTADSAPRLGRGRKKPKKKEKRKATRGPPSLPFSGKARRDLQRASPCTRVAGICSRHAPLLRSLCIVGRLAVRPRGTDDAARRTRLEWARSGHAQRHHAVPDPVRETYNLQVLPARFGVCQASR